MFNLILNVSTWTGTGNHSLAGFGVVLGLALVFDVTHVVASFLFALAFGPVLLRMLLRVRARLEVSWSPVAQPIEPSPVPARHLAGLSLPLALAAVVALGGTAAGRAHAAGIRAAPASRGVAVVARLDISRELAFLARAQNVDGGFGGAAGQTSSELYTAWVAMGLAASGRDPLSVRREGHSVLDALRGEAASLHGTGDLERTILALHACGASVHALAGGDPLARLLRARARDGSFAHLANLTAFAIFALRAGGYGSASPSVRAAARWLARQQERDGGFGFATKGAGSDVDDTAAVLQALLDAGIHGHSVAAGVGYPDTRSEPRRRLSPGPWWALQRPVDRLGNSGAQRCRTQPGRGQAPWVSLTDRLPGEPGRARRERALLAHRRADAGVGDRAGAHRARPALLPDRPSTRPHPHRRHRTGVGRLRGRSRSCVEPASGTESLRADRPRAGSTPR